MRTYLGRRGRQDVTEVVLVSGADHTRIRKLCELYLQHKGTDYDVLWKTSYDNWMSDANMARPSSIGAARPPATWFAERHIRIRVLGSQPAWSVPQLYSSAENRFHRRYPRPARSRGPLTVPSSSRSP